MTIRILQQVTQDMFCCLKCESLGSLMDVSYTSDVTTPKQQHTIILYGRFHNLRLKKLLLTLIFQNGCTSLVLYLLEA